MGATKNKLPSLRSSEKKNAPINVPKCACMHVQHGLPLKKHVPLPTYSSRFSAADHKGYAILCYAVLAIRWEYCDTYHTGRPLATGGGAVPTAVPGTRSQGWTTNVRPVFK